MKSKRVNRTFKCIVTGREIIVKPDKYEKLLTRWGNDQNIKKNFISFDVEKAIRDSNVDFWIRNSKVYKEIVDNLRKIIDTFNSGPRDQNALLKLQNDLTATCTSKLGTQKFEIIPSPDRLSIIALNVRGIAFINNLKIEATKL